MIAKGNTTKMCKICFRARHTFLTALCIVMITENYYVYKKKRKKKNMLRG